MPERHAHTIRNQKLENGKWVDFQGTEIPLDNGVGVSKYSTLLVVNDDTLVNPATGDVLTRTKKSKEKGNNKNYFSRETGILVNCWLIEDKDAQRDS